MRIVWAMFTSWGVGLLKLAGLLLGGVWVVCWAIDNVQVAWLISVGVGIAAGIYAVLGLLTLLQTFVAEAIWSWRWWRVERANKNVFKRNAAPATDEAATALYRRLPSHPGLYWYMPGNATSRSEPIGTKAPEAAVGRILGNVIEALREARFDGMTIVMGGKHVRSPKETGPLRATERARLKERGTVLLVKVKTLKSRKVSAFALGGVQIGFQGGTMRCTVFAASYYFAKRKFRSVEDRMVLPDRPEAVKELTAIEELTKPLAWLQYLPQFGLSVMRGWLFTTGAIRTHLRLCTGTMGEQYVLAMRAKEWRLLPVDGHHLEEVRVLLAQQIMQGVIKGLEELHAEGKG